MTAAIARVYQAQFEAHPSVTLAATNGGLTAFADIVAQTAQIFVSLIQTILWKKETRGTHVSYLVVHSSPRRDPNHRRNPSLTLLVRKR